MRRCMQAGVFLGFFMGLVHSRADELMSVEEFKRKYVSAIPVLAEKYNNYQLTIEQSFYWGDGSTQIREHQVALKGDRFVDRTLTKTDFLSANEAGVSERGERLVFIAKPGERFLLARGKDAPTFTLMERTKGNNAGYNTGPTMIANAPFNVLEWRARVISGIGSLQSDYFRVSNVINELRGETPLARVEWESTTESGERFDGWWILDPSRDWRFVEYGGRAPKYESERVIEITYQEVEGRPVPKSLLDFSRSTKDGTKSPVQREVVTAVSFDVPDELFELESYEHVVTPDGM